MSLSPLCSNYSGLSSFKVNVLLLIFVLLTVPRQPRALSGSQTWLGSVDATIFLQEFVVVMVFMILSDLLTLSTSTTKGSLCSRATVMGQVRCLLIQDQFSSRPANRCCRSHFFTLLVVQQNRTFYILFFLLQVNSTGRELLKQF